MPPHDPAPATARRSNPINSFRRFYAALEWPDRFETHHDFVRSRPLNAGLMVRINRKSNG